MSPKPVTQLISLGSSLTDQVLPAAGTSTPLLHADPPVWRQLSLFCAHLLFLSLHLSLSFCLSRSHAHTHILYSLVITRLCPSPSLSGEYTATSHSSSHPLYLTETVHLKNRLCSVRTALGTWLREKQEMHTGQGGKIGLWFLPFYLRAVHPWTSPTPLCASVSSPVKWGDSKAPHQRVAGGLTEIARAECFRVSWLVTRAHGGPRPFTYIIPFTCHSTLGK